MLKALLGHWKVNRKKPSLLPEEGDLHFEEPTTINPLFEDSDTSISSNKADSGENSASTETDHKEDPASKPPVDRLVDLAIPTSSSGNEGDVSDIQLEASEHVVLEKIVDNSTPDYTNDNALLRVKSDYINPESTISIASDESSESFEEVETESITFDIKGNMRLYQPPASTIPSNQQTNSKLFGSDKKELSEHLPSASKIRNSIKDITEGEKGRKSGGILKNNGEQLNSVTGKKESLPSSSKSNKVSINPEHLRARAIDELIKKFQNKPAENEESNKVLILDEQNLPGNSGGNDKTVNGLTKVEQNTSELPLKSSMKSTLTGKKDLERESLSNIFKFPPPPPLENIKQGSRLHGKILAQNPKTSPETSQTNPEENFVHKLDEAELGTTRSDSSLERTRVSSSKKPEKTSKVAVDTENGINDIVPETAVRKSFLHSPKNREICRKKQAELEQNDTPNIRTEETTTRSANTKDGKQNQSKDENTRINSVKNENPNPQAHSSKDNSFIDNKTKTESLKVDQAGHTRKDSQPEIPTDIVPNNSDSQSTSLKEIASKSKDSQPVPLTDSDLHKSNPKPMTSRDISFDRKESFKSPSNNNDDKHLSSESADKMPNVSNFQKSKLKSSLSKASAKTDIHKEVENTKSYSEDSGITRGDQISSEATQDATSLKASEETNIATNPRKSKKDKKSRPASKNSCKKCRRNHHDSVSIKRSPYDDYYDILTGVAHSPRSRHSDSCASELSWEERELLRKLHALRSHKGTVRSNAPSTRSRLSKHKYLDESHYQQFHKHRPSSDDSTLFAPSLCSCDECWAQYVREYSYSRASLRGMSPFYVRCTCRNPKSNGLGRRVKFMSDTIPEVPLPEKTTSATTTPAPKSDDAQQDNNPSVDKISQKSSEPKDSDSVSKNSESSKQKKLKFSEEDYRVMTPWELEQWNYLVRKQLLQKRRNRARCMGLIALALVIFVGLIVTILMVFLRRRGS